MPSHAGRVQSVALRLVCEREAAIEAFAAREFWSVGARLRASGGQEFDASLVQARNLLHGMCAALAAHAQPQLCQPMVEMCGLRRRGFQAAD